jgi:hypothetical protein
MSTVVKRVFVRLATGWFSRAAVGLSIALLCSIPALAQYGGGGGSKGGGGSAGTGSTSTGYGSPGYGNGKAIGIGVGAGVAGVAALYFAMHHGNSVTGCLQPGGDSLRVTDDKTGRTFSVMPGSTDVQPGERVQLKGKISKNKEGADVFQAKKLVKDLGACSAKSAELAHTVSQ